MKELSEQRFFRLLSEYSQKEFTVNDFTAPLQEIANHLEGLNRIVYNLSRGKNALLLLIDEAIGLVNTELRILNMRIKYPVQF